MLISVSQLTKILKVHSIGVVHVGAHLAEERQDYLENNWGKTLWIEAVNQNVEYIKNLIFQSGDLCIQALVWSESGKELDFNVSSNSQSSSIYEFGSHSKNYPDIVMSNKISLKTVRLDEIIPKDFIFDFVNLDIQGAELEALKGLGKKIETVKFIYTEVNKEEVYKGCPLISDIDEYLLSFGFIRVAVFWTNEGWGDAFYMRKTEFGLLKLGQIIMLNLAISNRNSLFKFVVDLGVIARKIITTRF
jgi:FkbM family methyltransferase